MPGAPPWVLLDNVAACNAAELGKGKRARAGVRGCNVVIYNKYICVLRPQFLDHSS